MVAQVLEGGGVDVLNHNVETVPRLYREVRPGSNFEQSLKVIKYAREVSPALRPNPD